MASMSTSIVCNDRIRDTEPSVSSSSRDGDTTSSSAVLTAPMAAVPQQLQDQHASAVASSVEMPVHQTVRRRSSARTGPTKQRASVTAATTANDASVHSKLLCSPVRCACVRHGKSGHIRDTIPSGCTSNDDTERSDDLHTEHCTTDDSLADLASATLPQHVCEPCAASPQRVCELGLQSGAGLSSEHQSAALLSSILASGNITASSTDLPPSKSSTVPWLSVVALTNPSPCNVASVTDTVDWAMVSPTARDRRLFRRWLSAVLFIAVLLMGTLYADAIRAGLVSTMRSPLMQQHASELQRMVHTLSTATKMGADHARTWLAPYSEMLVGFWLRYHRDVLSFLTQ